MKKTKKFFQEEKKRIKHGEGRLRRNRTKEKYHINYFEGVPCIQWK